MRRAKRNKQFWYMVFDGAGISYSELSAMNAADYYECLAAKQLWVEDIKARR